MASVKGCVGLRSLRLNLNRLSGLIPPGLGSLGLLEEIDLEGNYFKGPLPADTMAKLSHLRTCHG